jgi:hypothetical protein
MSDSRVIPATESTLNSPVSDSVIPIPVGGNQESESVITDAQLHQLANLICERLQRQANGLPVNPDRVSPNRSLVDAQELARTLGVSRSTIYEHSDELAAVEVGGGKRPRLRFDPVTALEAWTRRSAGGGSQVSGSPVVAGVRRVRRSTRSGTSGRLLPIRGVEAR